MTIRSFARAAAVATLFIAGSVAAQTSPTGSASITTTPVAQVTPGASNFNMGGIKITADAQGAVVTTIPVTVSAANGGNISNLTNCRLVNFGNTAISNNISALSSGTNVFTLIPALAIGSSSTMNLTMHCDVAPATPSNATFSFAAPKVLNANFGTLTIPGSAQGSIALAVPVTFTANGGGALSNLSNCHISNSSGATITNTIDTVQTPTNTFTFLAPLSVGGTVGSAQLTLRCNVASNAASGATFSAVAGTTIYAPGGGTVPAPTDPGTGTGTPGVPNTGMGDTMSTLFILALSALVALGSGLYLRRSLR